MKKYNLWLTWISAVFSERQDQERAETLELAVNSAPVF
jgi:hypothetical protein